MSADWKRKRFNNSIFVFNKQSFSICPNGSNDILPLKFFSDKIGSSIDFDSSMGVNLSDERDFTPCDRERETFFRDNVFIKAKTFWQMNKKFPERFFEYPRKACTMFFLSKSFMRFIILVIPKESLPRFLKDCKTGAIMSLKHPVLPEFIETFNGSVSAGFSLGNEYQVYSQKQMQSDNLGNTERIPPPACGRHFIVHLGYPRNSEVLPGLKQMFAQRKCLFIGKLARVGCMPRHIQRMERIESGNTFWPSKISWANQVCLLKISHLFRFTIGIRLTMVISSLFDFSGLSMTKKDPGNSRDGRNIMNFPFFEFPVNTFRSNSREGELSGFMGFQFFSDFKNLFNQILWNLSPDPHWTTAPIHETFKPIFSMPVNPLREPSPAPFEYPEYFLKALSLFVKLNCFVAFFIFILIFHCPFLLLNIFRRSLGNSKYSSRCYDIFQVHDVMI